MKKKDIREKFVISLNGKSLNTKALAQVKLETEFVYVCVCIKKIN